MMSVDPTLIGSAWHLRLVEDLQQFARHRQRDVARGAETPELAALIVEQYAAGLARAAALTADLLEIPKPDLTPIADRLVTEVDPKAAQNRERRWAARPARLVLTE